MAIKNRKCICCNTSYSYCPDCSTSDKLAPSWKATFCSEDCMKIWTTATKYNIGNLTKEEAKEIISDIKLKPIESYSPCVQRDLKVILAEEKKSRRIRPVMIETPVIERVESTIIEEAVETEYEVVKEEK